MKTHYKFFLAVTAIALSTIALSVLSVAATPIIIEDHLTENDFDIYNAFANNTHRLQNLKKDLRKLEHIVLVAQGSSNTDEEKFNLITTSYSKLMQRKNIWLFHVKNTKDLQKGLPLIQKTEKKYNEYIAKLIKVMRKNNRPGFVKAICNLPKYVLKNILFSQNGIISLALTSALIGAGYLLHDKKQCFHVKDWTCLHKIGQLGKLLHGKIYKPLRDVIVHNTPSIKQTKPHLIGEIHDTIRDKWSKARL